MYARVVRFGDVTPDRIASIKERVEADEGPPPGVRSTGMQLIYDEGQSTAVFIGFFASEQDMRDADEVFRNMDASETPGTRASIDQGEIKLERQM